MSEAFHGPFPRGPLLAAGALIGCSLIAAASARFVGHGQDAHTVAAAQSRELRFEDRPDGSVAVFDARSGALARTLAPGADGFVRATLRTMAHERQRRGAGPEVPFELARYADGRLVLADRVSGRSVDLEAFGSTNMAAFARLLDAPTTQP